MEFTPYLLFFFLFLFLGTVAARGRVQETRMGSSGRDQCEAGRQTVASKEKRGRRKGGRGCVREREKRKENGAIQAEGKKSGRTEVNIPIQGEWGR